MTSTASIDWPPLEPLAVRQVPPFPTAILPPVLRDMVEAVASTIMVPVELPGTIGLGVVGAALARRVEVQIGRTHQEPLNLYVAPAAESGERKGPALRAMMAPFERVEFELQEAARPRIAAAQQRRAVQEERQALLRKQAARATSADAREKAIAELEAVTAAMPAVPVLPTLRIGNTTPEQLERLLAAQGGAICVASEEAGALFEIAAGRYTSDGGAQLDSLLLGYDGGYIHSERVTRANVIVKRAALTIIVTPQPSILAGFRQRPEFRTRGLVARFLWTLGDSLVGHRPYSGRAIPAHTKSLYEATIRQLLALDRPANADEVRLVPLSSGALDVWRAHHDDLERQQADGGALVLLREWASKQASRVARIATGFQLVDRLDSPHVTADTMRRAVELSSFFVAHAMAAHELMGADPKVNAARRILRWILQRADPGAPFQRVDLFNGLRGFFNDETVQMDAPLALLKSRNYLRELSTPRAAGKAARGRKNSPTFVVHPDLVRADAAADPFSANSTESTDCTGQAGILAPAKIAI